MILADKSLLNLPHIDLLGAESRFDAETNHVTDRQTFTIELSLQDRVRLCLGPSKH